MLLDLPAELLLHIMSFVPPREVIINLNVVHSIIYELISCSSWKGFLVYPGTWKLFSNDHLRESIHIQDWFKEFKRRHVIEDHWLRGKLKSTQLLNNMNEFSHHGNLLAHVQFPKLIKCIHFEDRILATASNDNLIKLWDITSTQSLKTEEFVAFATLKGHTSLIQHMQFHNNTLVSGSLDGIHLWDMNDGTCNKVIHENERCYQLQFEDELLVHGHTFGFKTWDLNTQQMLRDENGQFSITCLAFKSKLDTGLGNGWLMACATHWGDVALWDLRSYQRIQTLKSSAHQIQISAVACDGGVEIYELRTATLLKALQFDQDVTSIPILNIKGDNLLVGCTAGFVRVIQLGKISIVKAQEGERREEN